MQSTATPATATIAKAFHEKPGRMLSQGRQSILSLVYSQNFWIIFWREKFVLWCCRRDENHSGYHPALVQLFRGIFFQGTWQRKC